MPNLESSAKHPAYDDLTCDLEDCRAGPYKRWADLERHQRKHSSQYRFECSAQYCKFTSARAFPRKDKLREHILAGHDDDTILKCPDDHECVVHITRDYLALHGETFSGLQKFRKCPIPKCSFKLNAARQSLDLLLQHLLEKHDARGRAKVAALLSQRGYDHATLQIMCPVCTDDLSLFEDYVDFYQHFLLNHTIGAIRCTLCPLSRTMDWP